MKKGYFTPPVLIILAIIIFAVAIVIAINTDLVKRLKNEASPTPFSSPTTQQPSPASDASPAPNGAEETANWKTYTNPQWKFSLSYPSSFYIKDKSTQEFWLVFDKKPLVEFPYITEGWNELSIHIVEQEFSESEIKNGLSIGEKNPKQIIFSGVKANKSKWDSVLSACFTSIIFNYSGFGWEISYPNILYDDGNKCGDADPIYDQILSTFQFLD